MVKTVWKENDESFMDKALEAARVAYQQGEVPIGAVVVSAEGKIIGSGFNKVESQKTQTAHAEIEALKEAAKFQKDWRLNKCTLYVTLEPCSMCIAALKLSRIKRVVFGSDSPLFGYRKEHSLCDLVDISFTSGVKETESSTLLNHFFEQKRTDQKIKSS